MVQNNNPSSQSFLDHDKKLHNTVNTANIEKSMFAMQQNVNLSNIEISGNF